MSKFSKVDIRRIAEILALIDAQPNRREQPIKTDLKGTYDFWFDGGACRVVTGYTEYAFADGTKVLRGVLRFFNLTIIFPDGIVIEMSQRGPDQ